MEFSIITNNGLHTKKPDVFEATLSSEELRTKHKDYKPEFIIEGLIFKNGLNIIGAERGTGKTRLMLAMAVAIAYGQTEFLGYKISHYGNIFFLNLEIPEAEFKLIVEPIVFYFENILKVTRKFKLEILSLKSNKHLTLKDVDHLINVNKPDIVMVDGYKALESILATENKVQQWTNQNMNQFYELTFDKWRSLHKVTIVISNHTNKGTRGSKSHSDLMYGAGAFMDYADQTTLLRKTDEPNQKLIIPDKCRYYEEGTIGANLFTIESDHPSNPTSLHLKLLDTDVNENDYRYRDNSNPTYSQEDREKAKNMHKEGKSLAEIAEVILGNPKLKGTISKWVNGKQSFLKFPS